MPCDICDDTRWVLLDYEEGGGFTYTPCPKCCYPHRAQLPIPSPVDALAFVSDRRRIALGEDEAWRQYAEERRI